MEEQTLHILNECSSGCKMAIHSMQQVLEYVENEKLEQVIMAAERKHKARADSLAARHEAVFHRVDYVFFHAVPAGKAF